MANLQDYFDKVTYKPTYEMGARVLGRYQGIPFIGTVGNDTQLNETDGPYLTIHLDLPIKIDDIVKNVIIVKHHEVNPLIDYDAPEADRIARASKTSGSGFDSRQAHQKKTKVETKKTKSESLLDRLKTLKGSKNVTDTKKPRKRTSR